jgi:hypothetical protein
LLAAFASPSPAPRSSRDFSSSTALRGSRARRTGAAAVRERRRLAEGSSRPPGRGRIRARRRFDPSLHRSDAAAACSPTARFDTPSGIGSGCRTFWPCPPALTTCESMATNDVNAVSSR